MKLTPMRAIRKKCLECSCGQITEIRECKVKTCALYPYRMGHRPKGEENIVESEKMENCVDSAGVFETEEELRW